MLSGWKAFFYLCSTGGQYIISLGTLDIGEKDRPNGIGYLHMVL